MSNPNRNEFECTLGGEALKLHASFNNLCDMEEKAGASLQALAGLASDPKKGLTMRQLAAIVSAGTGGKLTVEQAGELIAIDGFTDGAPKVYEFLNVCFSGAGTGSKKKQTLTST